MRKVVVLFIISFLIGGSAFNIYIPFTAKSPEALTPTSSSTPVVTLTETATPTPTPTNTPNSGSSLTSTPTPTVSPSASEVYPAERPEDSLGLSWGGYNNIFVTGVHGPWYNYGLDVGGGQYGLSALILNEDGTVNQNSEIVQRIGKAINHGALTVNWWLFPWGDNNYKPSGILVDGNGKPVGLSDSVYNDIDAMIKLANYHNFYWSFTLFNQIEMWDQRWINQYRSELVNVVTPLIRKYSNEPRIAIYNVLAEPEFSYWNHGVSKENVMEMGDLLANMVHNNSDKLVTIQSAFARSGINDWIEQGTNLDFYSATWYDYMDSGGYCMLCNDAPYYSINKPVMVFESYLGVNATYSAPDENIYGTLGRWEAFYDKGYAGTQAWSIFDERTRDGMDIDLTSMERFTSYHSNEVGFEYNIIYKGFPISLNHYKLTVVVDIGNVNTFHITGSNLISYRYERERGELIVNTAGSSFQVKTIGSEVGSGEARVSDIYNNYSWAFSFGLDDNQNQQEGINYLINNSDIRGTTYLIAEHVRENDNRDWIIDKPYIDKLLNNRWSIGNHTWSHNCDSETISEEDVILGYNWLSELVGPDYKMTSFAAPCFKSGYDPIIESLISDGNNNTLFNESGGDFFIDLDEEETTVRYIITDTITQRVVPWENQFKFGRDPMIFDEKGAERIRLINQISSPTHPYWYNTLTHSFYAEEAQYLINLILPYKSRVWVAPAEEIYSYLILRDLATISTKTLYTKN